jgi:hypothetical protein
METPCRAILNKQKYLFFKNREQEGKTGPDRGLWYQCGGEDTRKGCRSVNMGKILCTHA